MNRLKSNLAVKIIAFILSVVMTLTCFASVAAVTYLAINDAYVLNSSFSSESRIKNLARNDLLSVVYIVEDKLFINNFNGTYYNLLEESQSNFLYEVKDRRGNVIVTNVKDGKSISHAMDCSDELLSYVNNYDSFDNIQFRTESEAREYIKYCEKYFSEFDCTIVKKQYYETDYDYCDWVDVNWYSELFGSEAENGSSSWEDPDLPVEIKTDKDGERYYEAYKIVVENSKINEESLICTIGLRDPLTVYDAYYFAASFTDKLNEERYSLIAVAAITALLSVFLFCFLISSAGHKSGEEDIYLNFLDKIPYDIILAVIGLICFGVIYLFDLVINFSLNNTASVISLILTIVFATIILFLLFITTAARIKGRTLHKNWLIIIIPKSIFRLSRKAVKKAGKAYRKIADTLPLYRQAGLGILIWFVADLIVTIFFCEMGLAGEEELVLLILIKLLIIPVIALAVINMKAIEKGGEEISGGNINYKINTNLMYPPFRKHAEKLNDIGMGLDKALDEKLKSERMKTELITNVSHDIKTPLTSIINYVDLLKREGLGSPNAAAYIEVIDRQSARLKKLTVDLVEMSKATTGNMNVNISDVDVNVLLTQAIGEYSEKLQAKGLETVVNLKEDIPQIKADGNLLWRIFDNLLSNICKYSKYDTRVYLETALRGSEVTITFKNISSQPLNIPGEELMERFVRGDSSRNTEGSGLGLSIAQSLATLQNADFRIEIDGDLFKSIITFTL